MASEKARGRAAQAWCVDGTTSSKQMDPVLAEEFANILDEEWGTNKVQDLQNEIAVEKNHE